MQSKADVVDEWWTGHWSQSMVVERDADVLLDAVSPFDYKYQAL
jgi:uncharacterized protein YjdB